MKYYRCPECHSRLVGNSGQCAAWLECTKCKFSCLYPEIKPSMICYENDENENEKETPRRCS
jgi:NADH pyrophosphatase NudC (nudix superfamily)